MTLPKREYFFLHEIAQKLEITECDLQYYISHGHLLASVWLNPDVFQRACKNPCSDGGYDAGEKERFEGYAYIHPNTAREVLTCGMAYESCFYPSYPDLRITIADKDPRLLVRRPAMMVGIGDFESFVARHGIGGGEKPGVGGRPATTKLAMEEHARRLDAGIVYKSRMQEAQALYEWHLLHHKDVAPPSRNSIRNALMKFRRNPISAA